MIAGTVEMFMFLKANWIIFQQKAVRRWIKLQRVIRKHDFWRNCIKLKANVVCLKAKKEGSLKNYSTNISSFFLKFVIFLGIAKIFEDGSNFQRTKFVSHGIQFTTVALKLFAMTYHSERSHVQDRKSIIIAKMMIDEHSIKK